MFVSGDAYSTRVKNLFASDQPLDVAIAFWGTGAEAKAISKGGAPRRIICNLGSGGTNPTVIEKLRAAKRVAIKKLDSLHAKVVIGEDMAIVGSANFSANGLGLEDGELAHWHEAGYVVTDRIQLKRLRAWFDGLWSDEASAILPTDIENARKAWAQRRIARPKPQSAEDVFAITADNWNGFRDRQIYLIVWARSATKEEKERANRDRKERTDALEELSGARKAGPVYDYYHNWGTEISRLKHAQFIDVHWLVRVKRFECRGARRSINCGHSVEGGEAMDVMETTRHLGNLRFAAAEARAFAALMNSMHDGWYDAQRERRGASFVISLDEVLDARFGAFSATGADKDGLDDATARLLSACKKLVARDGQSARWIRMTPAEVRTGYGTTADKRLSAVVCRFRMMAGKRERECRVLTYMSAKESARFGKSKPSKNPDRTWLILPLGELHRVLAEIHHDATRAFLKRFPRYAQ